MRGNVIWRKGRGQYALVRNLLFFVFFFIVFFFNKSSMLICHFIKYFFKNFENDVTGDVMFEV